MLSSQPLGVEREERDMRGARGTTCGARARRGRRMRHGRRRRTWGGRGTAMERDGKRGARAKEREGEQVKRRDGGIHAEWIKHM